MCGRYYIDDETIREIEQIFHIAERKLQAGHAGKDIVPSVPAPVMAGKEREISLEKMLWGFPSYSQKGLLINARSETALEKPLFGDSILHRRCVIPARHFYEWNKNREKVTFYSKNREPLYLAGFYNYFENEARFLILTTQANASMEKVHHRMPLTLERGEIRQWLFGSGDWSAILRKIPELLEHEQEYEQQTLF